MSHRLAIFAGCTALVSVAALAQLKPLPVPTGTSPVGALSQSSTGPGAAGIILRPKSATPSQPASMCLGYPDADGGWECAASERTTPLGAGGGVDVTAAFTLAPRTRHVVMAPVPGVSAEHGCSLTPSFLPGGGTGLEVPLGLSLHAAARPAAPVTDGGVQPPDMVAVYFDNAAESSPVTVPAGHYHLNCYFSPVTASASATTDGGTP